MYCQNKPRFINNKMPAKVSYFKEDLISEILEVPVQKPDMQRILKLISSIEVLETDLIQTEVGLSNEGQNLAGYKLVAKVKVNGKITYSTTDTCAKVHSTHFEVYKTVFIVLPTEINGESICELVRAGAMKINPYVEGDKVTQLDARTFNACILFLVDVRVC